MGTQLPPQKVNEMTSNSSMKFAPFGRWTPQKRGAPYLERSASD
jgi:hypothetical protein